MAEIRPGITRQVIDGQVWWRVIDCSSDNRVILKELGDKILVQEEVFADFKTRAEARAWLRRHKKELLDASAS